MREVVSDFGEDESGKGLQTVLDELSKQHYERILEVARRHYVAGFPFNFDLPFDRSSKVFSSTDSTKSARKLMHSARRT